MSSLSPLELTTSITTIANAIAHNVKDNDKLDILAAALTQLGDTLATISLQRAFLDSSDSKNTDNTKTIK